MICMSVYVGMYVGLSTTTCMHNPWAELGGPNTLMLKVSFGRLKLTCDTHSIHFSYVLEQLQHGQKKNVHLEVRNLKQSRV